MSKQEDFDSITKIPRGMKKNENKYKIKSNSDKDLRSSNKNKRITNKDFKDFMNS
jgi:hypothetical protein